MGKAVQVPDSTLRAYLLPGLCSPHLDSEGGCPEVVRGPRCGHRHSPLVSLTLPRQAGISKTNFAKYQEYHYNVFKILLSTQYMPDSILGTLDGSVDKRKILASGAHIIVEGAGEL